MVDSGLSELWVIAGKGYAHATRTHKLTLQALWQILLPHSLTTYLDEVDVTLRAELLDLCQSVAADHIAQMVDKLTKDQYRQPMKEFAAALAVDDPNAVFWWDYMTMVSKHKVAMGAALVATSSRVRLHPKANTQNAAHTIERVIQKLQSLSPDAPCLLMGDFNDTKLQKSLNLHQYVTCPTRKNKTLDLGYGCIKGAYKASPMPPLGSSDHSTIHLIPV